MTSENHRRLVCGAVESMSSETTIQFELVACFAQVCFPGVYLAVSAVLQAGLLGELEGAALLDNQQGCGPAFKVLTVSGLTP